MISSETAQKILDRHNLGRLTSFEKQESGITGSVFSINNKIILKAQFDSMDPARSERNAIACSILQKYNIPSPRLIALDVSKELAPVNYVLISRLEGSNVRDIWKSLPEDEQKRLFFEYGKLMAKLHEIPMEKFGDPADKNRQFDEWYGCIAARFNANLKFAEENRLAPPEKLSAIRQFFSENSELLHVKAKPVFVHNDFQAKNIRYHSGKICGIFDFDEVLGAHNEMEFIKTCLPFKREKVWLKEILKGYRSIGTLSDKFEQRLKLYQLNFCLKMLIFAHSNGLKNDYLTNKFYWAINKVIKEDIDYFDFPSHIWEADISKVKRMN